MNDEFERPADRPTRDGVWAPRTLRAGDLSSAVPLRDALLGIGEVLQLPPKLPTAPSGVPIIESILEEWPETESRNTKTLGMPAIPAPDTYAAARRAERRWLASGALTLAAVIALMMKVSGDEPRRDVMPPALRAEWRTTNPAYAHTVLTFTDSVVEIATRDPGSDSPDSPVLTQHVITGLVADYRGEQTSLVVRYLVDGEPDQIEARLTSGPKPTLEFLRPAGLRWYPSYPGTSER